MNKFGLTLALLGVASLDARCSKYGDCKKIDMLSTLSVEELGWSKDTMCTSIWGWVDDRTDKKYVVLSCEPGHSIIDISNPQKPRAVARIAGEHGGNFRWRDVKIYKNHAFMVSDALLSRVQIVDLQLAVGKPEGGANPVASPTLKITRNPTQKPTRKNSRTPSPTAKPTEQPTTESPTVQPTEDSYEYQNDQGYEYEKETASPTSKFGGFIPFRGLRGLGAELDAKSAGVPYVKAEAVNVYTGGGIYQSHNIFINEDSGFAYAVGGGNNCNNGIHMIDIRDPKNPTFAGCFSDPKNPFVHDVMCMSYTDKHLDGKFQGREICYTFAVYKMSAVDVTDKKNPRILSSITYDGASYVHQGWSTTDRHFMIVDDERDVTGVGIKTFVVDIRDPEYLKLSHVHTALGETFGDHNQYVIKVGDHDFTFQANYAGGVRVLRINRGMVKGVEQVVSLEEVAYFDSNPANHNLMEGVWSVYPFFQEEKLIVMADMDTGFYVLRWEFEEDSPAIPYANGIPTPSPTSWADCTKINDKSKCGDQIACKWDWSWQAVVGWTDSCHFKPGSYKPMQPFRAPVGGPGKCSSLPSAQCNMYPACEKVGSKCRAFQLPN